MVLSAPTKRLLPNPTKHYRGKLICTYVYEIDIVHYILEAWLQVYLKQLAYLTVYC